MQQQSMSPGLVKCRGWPLHFKPVHVFPLLGLVQVMLVIKIYIQLLAHLCVQVMSQEPCTR